MRTSPQLIVCGHGKMAQALVDVCQASDVQCFRFKKEWARKKPGHEFPPNMKAPNYSNMVAVHFGSGDELNALIRYCTARKIPIIQGSTRLKTKKGRIVRIAKNQKIAILNAPNLSIPIVRLLAEFPEFVRELRQGMECSVLESHQEKKRDKSGTARKIAAALGLPEDEIIAVRSPRMQQALGIRKQNRDTHAVHRITIEGMHVRIFMEIEVLNRDTYAEGVIIFAQFLLNAIRRKKIRPGISELTDCMRIMFYDI